MITDPIFKMIELHRAAETVELFLARTIEKDGRIATLERWEAARTAADEAEVALCRAVPSTLEGVTALLDYLEASVDPFGELDWHDDVMRNVTYALARLSAPVPELIG